MRMKPRASFFFIVGGVALIVGELLHPEPPSDPAAFLGMVSSNDHWILCHFVQAAGALLVAMGFVDRGVSGATGSSSRLRMFAIAGMTLAIAGLAIDGAGFKNIANAWAAAPRPQALMLAAAFQENLLLQRAVIDAAAVLLFGFSPVLAGIAISHRHGGKLAGRTGIAVGGVAIALGSAALLQAPLPLLPWYRLIALAVAAWSIWTGVVLWRHPYHGEHDDHTRHFDASRFSGQLPSPYRRSPLDITKL
jgi:hypothetical protein